ncbi:MAG TPA: hypothetical protein IAC03_02995 [Candidatus Coprenecus pullistercoris]|nr:hypothetical protein [Candidatus Coprenecus pullistercoris]
MENVNEQKSEQTQEQQLRQGSTNSTGTGERKVSKAWEAAMRLKGSVVILDPTLYEQ